MDYTVFRQVRSTIEYQIKFFPNKNIMEICSEVSALTHVPLIAVMHFAKEFVTSKDEKKFERMLESVKKFYGYEKNRDNS